MQYTYVPAQRQAKPKTASILIADDYPIMRAGLKILLAHTLEADVVEAVNVNQLWDTLKKKQIDLIILDICMKDGDGLDVVKKIKEESGNTAVLVLSRYSEEQYALRAFQVGASGFVCKDGPINELFEAVTKILSGGTFISSSMSEIVLRYINGTLKIEDQPHDTLTEREFQVFLMLASCKSVGEIANELHVSCKTVSTHRQHILEKLRLKNNLDVIKYALKYQIIDHLH
jgi:two-component system invasion response regulator UvrY